MENSLFDMNEATAQMVSITQAVARIKRLIESAIITGGVDAKNNLIRTQVPICTLHDAAKTAFIEKGIVPFRVEPRLGEHTGEVKLSGFFKSKNQDICFIPNNYHPKREKLEFEGILKGTMDSIGQELTEHILSVNVRSQLSSTAKNFDTLYERTFAESLNLHLRCPNMVLGEFYMIPVYEYDDVAAKERKISFKTNTKIQEHIQKYIYSFNAINNRRTTFGEEYKYERVCLLVVDFREENPKIYNTNEELIEDGLLPRYSSASIEELNFPSFASSLLDIYESRFGSGRFI